MNSRKFILKNLQNAAPKIRQTNLPTMADAELFNQTETDTQKQLNQFRQKLEMLNGEFILVKSETEAAKKIKQIVESENGTWLIQPDIFSDPECKNILPQSTGMDLDNSQFAKYDFGISRADFLIARTGSVVLNSVSGGGRRLSVLPPAHIVVAEQKQLLPSLDFAFELMQKTEGNWSFATIISGPSRTSDIEKQLVLGAHGPKRLIVILIKNYSFTLGL